MITKKIQRTAAIVLFLSFSLFAQGGVVAPSAVSKGKRNDSAAVSLKKADSTVAAQAKDSTAVFNKFDSTKKADSSAGVGKAEESGSFTNPFSEEAAPTGDTGAPAGVFYGHEGHHAGIMTGIASQKPILDLLMDLSVGYSMSRFDIKSPFYSTEGRGDFLFNVGISVPFGQRFYAGIAFRTMHLKYGVSDSTADFMGSYFTTKAEESLSFISLPLSLGVKFELGLCSPYCYATCEPAFLTSAKQLVKRKTYSLFLPDSSVYIVSSVQDNETTDKRARFQVFVGGGAGMEINYGYGVIYIDGSARIALRETGYRDSDPAGTSSTLIVFPVSLGLRFYL